MEANEVAVLVVSQIQGQKNKKWVLNNRFNVNMLRRKQGLMNQTIILTDGAGPQKKFCKKIVI